MHSEKAKQLRVIALFDGRPGHEKQTMGIIQALASEEFLFSIIRVKVKSLSLIDVI